MPEISFRNIVLLHLPRAFLSSMQGDMAVLLRLARTSGFGCTVIDANSEFHRQRLIKNIAENYFDRLKYTEFYDPVWYLKAKAAMKGAGLGFEQSEFGFGQNCGFSDLQSTLITEELKGFWHKWVDRHLIGGAYDALVVLLCDPNQLTPCKTLVEICRQKKIDFKLHLALAREFDSTFALPVEKDFDSVFSLDDRADDWPWEQTEDGLGKNDANRQLKVESCVFPQRVWHLKTRDLDLVKDLEGNFWISAPNMTPPQLVEHLPFYAKDRSSARLGLELNLDLAHGQPDFSSWQDKGICLIHWLIKPNMPGELKDWIKVLRQVSKLGIWNHLVLPPGNALSGLADFCTANPNMGHSWQRLDAPLNPEDYDSYGRAQSLPGNPFWLSLSRPDHMLLYLARHGLTKLMRLRVIGGNQVYEVGQGLVYNFAKPQELPPGYLDQICHMVEDGGAVGKTWVRHNLERAHLIGYVEEKGVIVAAGCLKHPRPEYVEMVREQTGLDLSGHVERGYTTVRPEYRGLGIGTELLAGETKRAGEKKVYSIISSDNLGAQKMALRNKTQKIATYFSPRLQKEISVWMPESMLP